MRLFDDSFDIFNDELDSATGATETNIVNVSMPDAAPSYLTLESILEDDANISVSLDLFESDERADLDFVYTDMEDLAYFGSVYTLITAGIDKIKKTYPNGFSILSATVSTGTISFDIDNTYLYGSGSAFPTAEKIVDYTLYEINSSTGEIENTIDIISATIGLTYGVLYLTATPLGVGYDYIVAPNDTLTIPFISTLSEYERSLLEPPFDKSNFWPRDAIVNSILVCEGEPFTTFAGNEMSEAIQTDNEDTNIMWRKLFPQGQKMLDNDDGLMKRLILTYAMSFDVIKRYQDHLAYAHTIDYSPVKHIPDDLVTLLANQWNWALVKDLNQSDISEYIYPTFDNYVTGQSQQQLSGQDINFERWRRILANIVFLYKKKGTRAGLKFFANIYGIPERLFSIEELINIINIATPSDPSQYIVAPSKIVVHTSTGPKYVEQNGAIKIWPHPGAINTTFLSINISPVMAIEFEYFDWGWQYHPDVVNVNGDLVNFQSTDVPNEGEWFSNVLQNLIPSDGTARYASSYPLLENEGVVYYANAATPWSMDALQPYIDFLDDNWATIAHNLIPAASKLLSTGTIYRNQFWNRQKHAWDARELEQKELPFNEDIELQHVQPHAVVEEKKFDEIEIGIVDVSLGSNTSDSIIIQQVSGNVNSNPESNIEFITEEADQIDTIEDGDIINWSETTGGTNTVNSPYITVVDGENNVGIGVSDFETFSPEFIIQSIDNWVTFNCEAGNLSNEGYTKFDLNLYELKSDSTTLSDESYSILNVIYENENYGSYKLSSTNGVTQDTFITIDSAYVPYLNKTVKIESVDNETNIITTNPPIKLFHLPLGAGGSQINWLTYIGSGMLGMLDVAHNSGAASYQSLIDILHVLSIRLESNTNFTDQEWDAYVFDNATLVPIPGNGDSFQMPDHGLSFQNKQIIVAALQQFDNQNVEFIYASILILEFLKINPNYALSDNPWVMIGSMLQNHTRATFKRVINFFDWGAADYTLKIDNETIDDGGTVQPNAGDWELPDIPFSGEVDLTIASDNSLGNPDPITGSVTFGGFNILNDRILKDKTDYFYTLKASTSTPFDWEDNVVGLDYTFGRNVIDSAIINSEHSSITYYGKTFTFFDKANEPQLVSTPDDVSTEFFAPYKMPPTPSINITFNGVSDADRLEIQYLPVTGTTTYGDAGSNGIQQLTDGVGIQDSTGDNTTRRLSWYNWLAAHVDPDDIANGPTIHGNADDGGSVGEFSWDQVDLDTIDSNAPRFSGTDMTSYLTGNYNTTGYDYFWDFMLYWENDDDAFWTTPHANSYEPGEPTGKTTLNLYYPVYPIDNKEISDHTLITDDQWINDSIIKIIDVVEYATDGYLYQIDTILNPYQAYWWRIVNIRNTSNIFSHNLEIFTSSLPKLLGTGPGGHDGHRPGVNPEIPDPPTPPEDDPISPGIE